MKSIRCIYKVIILVFGLSVFSCTKLEDQNFGQIISSQFEPTDSDFAALVGEAYVAWRQTVLEWNGYWRVQEVSADQVVIPARPNGWVDGGVYRRLHEHKWTSDDDFVIQTWRRAYSGITTTNRVLFQIESGSLPVSEGKNEVIAELRVLRASYYYILCDVYGNVPIITDFDVPEGFLPEQNTRKEVYDFIVEEITESIPNLSIKNDQTTYGRFNKWAASTLLAKMYLNAEVYSGATQWQKCIEACDAVINSGAGYGLDSDQKFPFLTENQNSKELIFALAIDETYTTAWNTFDIHMQTLQPANQATYDLQFTPWGGMCAIPQGISSFDEDDARLTDNWIYGQQYSSGGDTLYATLGAYSGQPLNFINELPGVDQSEEVNGYRLGKFEIATGSTNILNNDWPVFRYADVLLMKAESMLRLGDADGAAAIVTQVRERSFKANPSKATVTGAELAGGSSYDYGLRNHLESTTEGGDDITFGRMLDELGWEFAQEGHRRQDLIRFGVFTTKSWLSHAPNGSNKIIFPIPRVELNTNPNLSQNSGY
ncbi:RagB/SusD family nutrient uptake outer membrane protein [Flammeovirgaceae bacterium SG7u.111]|nr:RagB/SusD family nutrient uptake outer membrane protein [Flammeovirgaceae bacterium SG7u.132]WPO36829.1 RagB/SusD family nutrient uptake outer membrane protein [Flammeovirgaceae bacterium SG7u.111]